MQSYKNNLYMEKSPMFLNNDKRKLLNNRILFVYKKLFINV